MRTGYLFLSTCGIAALSLSSMVHAQSAEPGTIASNSNVGNEAAEQQIVVTGTYIGGSAEDSAVPVDVITSEELVRQGSPTIVELMKSLPSSAGVVGDSNQFGAGQTTGSGSVNLRGLGAPRTLVLLNGRRLASAPTLVGSVDTNLLPLAAVGRVEVLKDGAAALYGSDAVAGVVNFITRTDLDGFEAAAGYSFIDGSDGDYNFSLNWGKRFDRGNILLSAAYRHRSELSVRDRDFAEQDYYTNPQGGFTPFGNPGTYTPITAGGSPAGVFVDPACTLISGPVVPTATGVPQCVFRYTSFDNLVEDEDHYQLFGQANYEISDGIELHLEGLWASHDVPHENSSPSYSPVQFPTAAINGRSLLSAGFFIPASNPGLKALLATYPASSLGGAIAANQAGVNGVSTTILWRPLGVSGNPLTGGDGKEDKRYFEAFRISGGITAELGGSLKLDTAATYMENSSDIATPDIVVSRLELALRGLGGFGCNVAANTPGANGCLYFNPFSSGIAASEIDGRVNPNYVPSTANSIDVIDYLFEDYAYRSTTKLFVADAVLSGETGINLAGGPIGFAVGGQYRRNTSQRDVDALLDVAQFPCVDSEFNGNQNCVGRQNGVFSFFGPLDNYSYQSDVYAAFAELQLPVTDAITAQAAVRYESYGGDIGSTLNPKLAVRWQLTDWLALRGSVSTTFRAPPQTLLIPTPTTTLAFTSAVGGYRAYDTFGNPDLQPETADAYNAGIIVQTGGFNATFDYYRFDFQGGLDNEPGTAMVAALFPTGVTDAAACATAALNPAFLSRFTFNNNVCSRGNLLRTRLNQVNGPDIRTSGIDFAASLRRDMLGGRAVIGVDGSYVIEYKAGDFLVEGVLVSGGDDFAGQLDYLGYGSIPDLKGQAYAEYSTGPHTLRGTVRYVGGMTDSRGATTFTAVSPLGKEIDEFVTADLSYTLDIEPLATTLSVTVQNITDEDPPFARLDLNYDPFTGNPLGRVVKVGIRKKF